jgi:serine/threonine protein phosphatase PrpC
LHQAFYSLLFYSAVTADPELTILELSPNEDDFVVLATDGLWDVMSSPNAVAFIHALLEASTDDDERDQIATMLVEEALRRGSYDNITVIIVWLKDKKIDS